LQVLERNDKVNLLSDGQVTTLSGRQAQLQVVNFQTIVTNISPQALKPPGISSSKANDALQTAVVPLGPVLDVIPTVAVDGYTVQLKVTATLTEFLGYEPSDKNNLVTIYLQDKKAQVVRPQPKLRVRQLTTDVIVWDGQTVVLGGLIADETPAASGRTRNVKPSASVKKNLLVFITPII